MPDGLEERKNELFATITLLAGVKRDIVAAQAAGKDALALYDRQAQLEADKERLSHEVNSEYMYRNLQAFMNRVEQYDASRKDESEHLSSQIGGLRGDNAALQAEFRSGLQGIQSTVSTLAETVVDLQTQMRESQEDRQSIHEELAAVKENVAKLQEHFSSYIAGSRRNEIDDLKGQLHEMRGDYSPEERARLTSILLQMIAAWEADHPEQR